MMRPKPKKDTGGRLWDKTHPDWEEGCADWRMIEFENRATMSWLAHNLTSKPAILDVGAGSGCWSKQLFPLADRCDAVPSPGIRQADMCRLPYPDLAYDLVHARRVLSNITPERRCMALREVHRVLRPGGRFLLLDVFLGQYEALNEARRAAGMPWLPRPKMGGMRVNLPDVINDWPGEVCEDIPVGADYFVSTRLLHPINTGQETPEELRDVVYCVSQEAQERFGVHRLVVLRK